MFSNPRFGFAAPFFLLLSLTGLAFAQSDAPAQANAQDAPYTYVVAHDPWPEFLALIEDDLDAHPALIAQRSEALSAHRMVDAVGFRPDPTLSLSAVYLPWKPPSLRADPMSGIELGLSVPIWFPKELNAQKAAVRAQAEALEVNEDTARTDLLIRAVELFYEVYAIDRAILALEAVKPLLQEHIELLKNRIPTGHATVVQVERVRLNLMRLEDQIHTQKDARPAKVARLNALLHRPQDRKLPSIAEHATVSKDARTSIALTPDAPLAQLPQLVDEGMAHRPTLRAIARQKDSAHAEAEAAAWAKRPQLEVFGSWMFRANPKSPSPMDDGMDMFSIGLQSTLPFSGRHRANAAQDVATARAVALDATAAAFEQELRGELAAHLEELHRIAEHAQFYKNELIPQAHRVRDAAMSGLSAQRADYEAWLDAEQQLAEFEVSLAQLEANILTHHAMIRMLTHAPETSPSHAQTSQEGDLP